MAGSVNKVCECCGEEFSPRRSDSARQRANRRFCSPTCSNRSKPLTPLHIRFWQNVQKQDGNKCWIWTGAADEHGYGRLGYGGRENHRLIKSHRLSYEMRFGPIEDGHVICHTCDNPSCVNPHHLFSGTQKDNTRDTSRKGRLNPKSLENLRPGAPSFHGAGPRSNKEIAECQGQ